MLRGGLLEGRRLQLRVQCPLGEGGAGTFSDGKARRASTIPVRDVLGGLCGPRSRSSSCRKAKPRAPTVRRVVKSVGMNPAGRRGALQHPGDRFFSRSGPAHGRFAPKQGDPGGGDPGCGAQRGIPSRPSEGRGGDPAQALSVGVRASLSPRSTGASMVTYRPLGGGIPALYRETTRSTPYLYVPPGGFVVPRRRIVWSPTA